MPEIGAVGTVAVHQVGELLRIVHARFLARVMPVRAFGLVVAVVVTVVVSLSTLRAAHLGDELHRLGMGVGLVLTPAFVVGACAGAGAALARHLWRRSIDQERDRLSVLPLTARRLSVLALVPTAFPMAVGAVAVLAPLLGYSWAMEAGTLSTLGALGAGAGLSVALFVVIRQLLALVTRGRDTRAAPFLLVVALLAQACHALWVLSRDDASAGRHALAPLVWIMGREVAFRPPVSLAILAGLALVVWAAAHPPTAGAPRPDRQIVRGTRSPSHSWGTPLVRWWGWLLRIGVRQGSLVTEVATMGAIAAAGAGLVVVMWRQARTEHAYTFMLVCALFAAIPLLGLRAGQGPTQRLVQLGVRPADGRVGVVVTGAVTLLLASTPSFVVLVSGGVRGAGLVRFVVLLALAGSISLVVGSLFRSVATTSVGRAAASVVFMGVLAVTMRTRVHLETELILLSALTAAGAVLAATLHRTFRATTVD